MDNTFPELIELIQQRCQTNNNTQTTSTQTETTNNAASTASAL